MGILFASLLLSFIPIDRLENLLQGNISIVNNLPSPIVSVYSLNRDMRLAPRSRNLLDRVLQPGDTVLLTPTSVSDNILLMDSAGDSYVCRLPDNFYSDGLVHVDMSCMGFSVFHTGSGSSPLVVVNRLQGLRLDHVIKDGPGGPDLLGRHVLFPGERLIVWTEPGDYELHVIDASGAEIELERISLPDSGMVVHVDNGAIQHLGSKWETGTGNSIVELRNALTVAAICSIRIEPLNVPGTVVYEPPVPLGTHDRASIALPEGIYDLYASDTDGARYSLGTVQTGPDTSKLIISDEDLVFDISFRGL
mgnify:CR=1 FL=1